MLTQKRNTKNQNRLEHIMSSYPKLWEEGENCSLDHYESNYPSQNMPKHIRPGSEESFHWARSVPNTLLSPSSRVTITNPCGSDESFLVTYIEIACKSMVVAQEFVLSALFLAGHRCLWLEMNEDEGRIPDKYIKRANISATASIILFGIWITLARKVQMRQVNKSKYRERKESRLWTRFQDCILIALMLRLLSSVLRALTASYSSDTVMVLAISGMVLHVATNDYKYANGFRENSLIPRGGINVINLGQARPSFASGTVSLNFSFLVAALLTSRLESDFASYLYFIQTVVLFAHYPSARHIIALTYGDKAGV